MGNKKILIYLASLFIITFSLGLFFLIPSQKTQEFVPTETANESIDLKSITINSCPVNEMTVKELELFVEKNNYNVYKDDDEYIFYNRFALKKLLIPGEFKSSKYGNSTYEGLYTVLTFETEEETETAYNELSSNPNIKVYYDTFVKLPELNDYSVPLTPVGWGYNALEVQSYINYLNQVGAESEEVVVAVIDTGINTSHVRLKDRILKDANGNYVGKCVSYIDDSGSQYEFEDDRGHGSHVAGIICDTTPSNVKILPVKAIGNYNKDQITFQESLEEYNYLVDMKVNKGYNIVAVNMSYGAVYQVSDGYSIGNIEWIIGFYEDCFQNLIEKDILPVAAMGNERSELTNQYASIPASCPSVVSVTALKQSGSNYLFDSNYSNYGSLTDISAPGTGVNSAYIGSSTEMRILQGTSMASPYVAAVTALLACDPIYQYVFDAPTIEERLYDLAIDLGTSGKDKYYGMGMVSLKNYQSNLETIDYTSTPVMVEYDGQGHNISIIVNENISYTIKYGLLPGNYDYTYDEFIKLDELKNVTNGAKKIYFCIQSDYKADTVGYENLTITPIETQIFLQPQSTTYGEASIKQTKYTLSRQPLSGENIGITTTCNINMKSDCGDYDLGFTWSNSNYNVTLGQSAKLTINPRPITIEMASSTSSYGENTAINTNYSIVSGSVISKTTLQLSFTTTATNTSNVGEYPITLSGYNHNYAITIQGEHNYTITKRSIIISIEQSSIYGDVPVLDPTKYTINSGSIVGNDVLIEKLTIRADEKSDAGQYIIYIDKANPNYNISTINRKFTINKRPAVVNVIDVESVYGNNINIDSNLYEILNVVNDDIISVTLSTAATKSSSVGTYDIIATIAEDNNYTFTNNKGTLTITKRPIEIEYIQSSIYGEENRKYNATYKDVNNSLVNNDNLALVVQSSVSQFSAVGEYQIIAVSCNSNYDLTLSDTSKLTIIPRNISIAIGDMSHTYGNNINLSSVSIDRSQVLNNDNLNIRLTTTATSLSPVGEYDISLTYNNSNYTVSVDTGILTITKRPIDVKITKEFTYGDPINVENIDFDDVNNKLINDDNLNLVVSTNAVQYSNVGDYGITLVSCNPNYDVTINNLSKISIIKRNITVRIGNAASQFGGSVDLSGVQVDTSEVVNNDNLNIDLFTTANNDSLCGQYDISLTYNNNNYNVSIVKGVYQIYQKIININIGNQTSIYGEQIILDDDLYDIVDEEIDKSLLEVKLSVEADNLSPVGQYDIILGESSDNYLIRFNAGKLTIITREIDIKISQEIKYGEVFSFNGIFEDVNNKLINGDDLNLNVYTTVGQFDNIGDYTNCYALISCNDNYNVTINSESSLKITPRDISIKIGNATKVYLHNVELSDVSIDTSEIVNNDDLNIVLTTNATKNSPVGNYGISLTYTNDNYNVDIIDGVLTITKYELFIEIDDYSLIYGEEIVIPNSLVKINDNLVVLSDVNIQLETNAVLRSDVDDYEITIKSYSGNYNIANYDKGILHIIPRDVFVTVGNAESIYGDEIDINNINIEINGILEGDILNATAYTNAIAISNCGVYDINAVIDNNNYYAIVTKGVLTINPRNVRIQTIQFGTYGDNQTIDITNYIDINNEIVNGDSLNLELKVDVNNSSSVGVYQIELIKNNTNYTVTLEDSHYEILPRHINVGIGNTYLTYGEAFDSSKVTFDASEVVNDDVIIFNTYCEVNKFSKVGDYEITATYENDNYEISFNNGICKVIAREVEVLIENESQYGDLIDNRQNNIEVLSGEVVNNDNLQIVTRTTANSKSAIGEYSVSIISNNSNYEVVLNPHSKHEVKRRRIIITISDIEGSYKEDIDLTNVKVDLSEVVNNDDLNIEVFTLATQLSDIGTYDIDMTYNNDNYEVSIVKGNYKINKRTVVIYVKDYTFVYGSKIDNNYEFTTYDYDVSIDELGVVFSDHINETSDVGVYNAEIKSNNANFNVKCQGGKIEILPRSIKVKLKPQEKKHFTFLKPDQSEWIVSEGVLLNNDNLDVEIYIIDKFALGWGEYSISGKNGNKNYNVEFENSYIIIEFSTVDIAIISAIGFISLIAVISKLVKVNKLRKEEMKMFKNAINQLNQEKNDDI